MCIIRLPMITKILIIAQQKIKQPNNVVSSARYWLQEQKIIANEDPLSFHHDTDDTTFSNSSIIHEENTKEIIILKQVWICDPNYHKIRSTFTLNFSKNY